MLARSLAAASAAAVVVGAGARADIVNGDFSAGNTGFTSEYDYRVVSTPPHFGQYGVTTTSFAWTQFWHTLPGDHTTGTGQFLIADVGPDLSADIWSQTVAVAPGEHSTLTAWLANWTSFAGAALNVYVNDSLVTTWGPQHSATWTQFSASWDNGPGTSAIVSLRAASYFQPGADIAIDDIHLVPAPAAAGLLGLAALAAARRRR